jgi:hypothetical protein
LSKAADKRQQEVAARFQETAAQMKESKAEHDRIIAETRESQKETAARIAETTAQMKDTDKKIKELNNQMGGLHRSFGDLAEHLVAPGIAKRFNELGYHFDAIATGGMKIYDEHGETLAQIDLLLQNGDFTVAAEVKSKPREDDIDDHIKRLEILRQYMDKHHDRRIVRGAIAGAIFSEPVKKAATKAGLYVIVQSGDTMNIENPKGFTPREWPAAY